MVVEQMDLDVSDITTETAIVHELPPIGAYCYPLPSFRYAKTASLTMKDIHSSPSVTVITGTMPMTGQELTASREQFVACVKSMEQEAAAEGGNGYLLGYDPLNPEARICATDLGMTDGSVFQWDRGPGMPSLFDWSDVAHVVTSDKTARVFLASGKVVSLHAAIDWWNLLG